MNFKKMTDLDKATEQYRDGLLSYKRYRECLFRNTIRILLEKDFDILDYVGKGTYGDVFSASIPGYDSDVALKIIHSEDTAPGEIEIWKHINHANVLPLLEMIQVPQMDVFVTPLMKTDLSQIMYQDDVINNPSGLNLARFWLNDVLCGLDYLHSRNIYHLDLKSNNVLISFQNRALLSDFSFIVESKEMVNSYGLCNEYRPPEACPSLGLCIPVDGTKFDVWSFGLLALNLFTKFLVFQELHKEIKCWRKEIFPLLCKAFKPMKFLQSMKRAFPSSNITLEVAVLALRFMGFVMKFNPQDRPPAAKIMDHLFLRHSGNLQEAVVRVYPDDTSPNLLQTTSDGQDTLTSTLDSCNPDGTLFRVKRKKNFLTIGGQNKKGKTGDSLVGGKLSPNERIDVKTANQCVKKSKRSEKSFHCDKSNSYRIIEEIECGIEVTLNKSSAQANLSNHTHLASAHLVCSGTSCVVSSHKELDDACSCGEGIPVMCDKLFGQKRAFPADFTKLSDDIFSTKLQEDKCEIRKDISLRCNKPSGKVRDTEYVKSADFIKLSLSGGECGIGEHTLLTCPNPYRQASVNADVSSVSCNESLDTSYSHKKLKVESGAGSSILMLNDKCTRNSQENGSALLTNLNQPSDDSFGNKKSGTELLSFDKNEFRVINQKRILNPEIQGALEGSTTSSKETVETEAEVSYSEVQKAGECLDHEAAPRARNSIDGAIEEIVSLMESLSLNDAVEDEDNEDIESIDKLFSVLRTENDKSDDKLSCIQKI